MFKILKHLLIIIFVFCVNAHTQPKKYNIVFIVADDMNDYGFLKTNEQVIAPNIENFRKNSITFTHTYCAAPACSPSRTAFLSGVAPYRSGKYYNGSKVWDTPLMEQQETMMEYFQRIGYDTYGKGKLFHSKISKTRVARNFLGSTGKAGFGPFPDSLHRVFGTNSRFRGVQSFPKEEFPDVQNAKSVIKIINQKHEKPFFIMYGLWRPHSPYTCPKKFLNLYDPDSIKIPAGYLKNDLDDLPKIAKLFIESGDQREFDEITVSKKQWQKYLRGYFACYSFADDNIGKVIKAVEQSKYAQNTIVIVTSDNGFHMGEKNRFNKNSLWEQSAITPLAIRIPKNKFIGSICSKPINLLDIYPTLVDIVGENVHPLKPLDGHSFLALINNPNTKWEIPSITSFGKEWISLRDEQFRYIRYSDGSEELYNHYNDKYEWNNLAGNRKYSNTINKFKKFIPKKMVTAKPGRWTTRINKVEKLIQGNNK